MPDREWDFEHLELAVRVYPELGRVEGSATHTVRLLGPIGGDGSSAGGPPVLRLHAEGLEVDEVRVDGQRTHGWRVGDGVLDVPIPVGPADSASTRVTPVSASEPERRFAVEVRYSASPQAGLHFRGPAGARAPSRPGERAEVWSQGEAEDNRHWLPTWDYPSDRFTVSTTVEAPRGLTAFANGALVERRALDDGWVSWRYELDRAIPAYLVAIAVGAYEVYDAPPDPSRPRDVPLTYVVGEGVGEATARRTFGRTRDQLAYFEDLLDEPFPWAVYRQVAVQGFLFGGMENASTTLVNDRRLLTTEAADDERTDTLVAHELAHQWFGDLLTCYGWRELWLNEGFATFYAGRWQEHHAGPERYAELVRQWFEAGKEDPDHPMAARSARPSLGEVENAAVYGRGAAVLHMLRVYLGDAVFDAGIRRYVHEHRDGFVDSDQLRRILEDLSGHPLGWLFDQWVTGAGVARWSASHTWRPGQLEVTLDQTRDTEFSARVELEIGRADGTTAIERAWLGPGRTVVALPLDEPPRYVAVDPRGGVLAAWSQHQAPAEWLAQAITAREPYARLTAIEALGHGPADASVVGALAELLGDTAQPRAIRRAAAAALGQSPSPLAAPALARALQDRDIAVGVAAGDALAELRVADPASTEAVRRTTDAYYPAEVRASALAALVHLDGDAARRIARAWLSRPDPSAPEWLHVAGAEALGTLGSNADLRALIARIDERASSPAALAAAGAAAVELASARGAQDDARRDVARVVEPLLHSRNLRMQQAAIRWLGRIGDARSEQALLAYADQSRVTVWGLPQRAREAAAWLRDGVPSAPAPPDLARIRRELSALEERIGSLELGGAP